MRGRRNSAVTATVERSSSVIRCGIHTRVFTDDQAWGDYSYLASQRDICEHAIAIHREEGWVSTAYFEDPCFSGKDMDRPGIQALLEDAERGNLDIVVAYKIDRITRSMPDFYEFWRRLEARRVNFVSATQSFDTGTPAGMLMLNMLLSFGQFEPKLIAERTAHKMEERTKGGYWHGRQLPTGYTNDGNTKLLSPDPIEAPLVERIYRLTVELTSPTAVAKVLNAEGHKTGTRPAAAPSNSATVRRRALAISGSMATASASLRKAHFTLGGMIRLDAQASWISRKAVWDSLPPSSPVPRDSLFRT